MYSLLYLTKGLPLQSTSSRHQLEQSICQELNTAGEGWGHSSEVEPLLSVVRFWVESQHCKKKNRREGKEWRGTGKKEENKEKEKNSPFRYSS